MLSLLETLGEHTCFFCTNSRSVEAVVDTRRYLLRLFAKDDSDYRRRILRVTPLPSYISLASLGAITVDLIDGRYMYLCVGLGLGLGVFPMFGLHCRKLPRLVNHAIIAVARYRSYCLVKLQRFESLMDRNNVTCWYKRSPGLLASSRQK